MADEATPAGTRAVPDLTIDVAGLQRIYPRTYQSRSRVWPLVMVCLAALFAVPRIVSGDWFDTILGLVVLTSIVINVITYLWRPPATIVHEHGLRIRKVIFDGHLLPWSEVEQIRPQGRWENHSTAVTRGGRQVPLIGVPRDTAQRLAEALEQAQAL